MTTCDGLFEIKQNTIPVCELLYHLSAEQLQEIAQQLFDSINWNYNRKTDLLLKVVKFKYFCVSNKEIELKYNCPA